MRPLSLLLGLPLLCCCFVLPLAAQEVEPYQLFSAAFGWGAIGPRGGTGTGGDAADGGGSIQFGLDLELRQTAYVFAYVRADADAADVRQHLGLSGGVRIRPLRSGSFRPVIGAGIGVYWLEPKVDVSRVLRREFTPRAEGHAGAEWLAVPGLRLFLEYRLIASRYAAVVREPGCTTDLCLSLSDEPLLHLAHTGWFGIRLRMF